MSTYYKGLDSGSFVVEVQKQSPYAIICELATEQTSILKPEDKDMRSNTHLILYTKHRVRHTKHRVRHTKHRVRQLREISFQ